MKKPRESKFELLRIFALVGVVIAHMIGYSAEAPEMFGVANKQTWFLATLSCAGKIGLITLVMVTGYFLVKSKFSFRRILKVWEPTWIYSILILIGAAILGAELTAENVTAGIFPVLGAEYWFVPTYVIIVLISPVMNKLLTETPREKLRTGLFATAGVFFGVNFITGLFETHVDLAPEYRILTYLIAYAFGGYLRLYPPKIAQKKRWMILIAAVVALVAWRWGMVYPRGLRGPDLWAVSEQDIFVFATAAALFSIVAGMKMKYNRVVNLLGGATFAVYLITENPFVRKILWEKVDIYSVYDTKLLYIYPFAVGAAITAACLVIEIIRQRTVTVSVLTSRAEKPAKARKG